MTNIENLINPEFYFDFIEMEKEFEFIQLVLEINKEENGSK